MKLASLIMATLLLASVAKAEVLVDGKVYKVTADRIIAERQLQCSYGQWRLETAPNGSTIIIRDKVCTNGK